MRAFVDLQMRNKMHEVNEVRLAVISSSILLQDKLQPYKFGNIFTL